MSAGSDRPRDLQDPGQRNPRGRTADITHSGIDARHAGITQTATDASITDSPINADQ